MINWRKRLKWYLPFLSSLSTWPGQPNTKKQRKKMMARIKDWSPLFPLVFWYLSWFLGWKVLVVSLKVTNCSRGSQVSDKEDYCGSGWLWSASPRRARTCLLCKQWQQKQVFWLWAGDMVIHTPWSWRHMALPQGNLLASNFSWEGAPVWLGHLQNNLPGEVGGATLRPPPSLSFLTMCVSWRRKQCFKRQRCLFFF